MTLLAETKPGESCSGSAKEPNRVASTNVRRSGSMPGGSGLANLVTRDDAERALLEAVDWLGRLGDRERAFLRAGSRSCWPEILRSRDDRQLGGADYAEGEGYGVAETYASAPSAALSRRQYARLEAMLLNPDCAAMAVPEGHRSLVGRVLVMLNWPGGDEFSWARVWVAEGGRGCGVTSDALRARFDRAVGRVARRMEVLGLGLGAGGGGEG